MLEGLNVYFITGTSRGLGKALAAELLNGKGNRVFGIGRNCTISHDRYHHYDLDLSAPGVVDTGMQAQIRAVPKKDFASKERFKKMKTEGLLAPADETARCILKILARPEKYAHVCLDVRDLR
jgi:NADP-dependent 3-hydroxy acid dehydrogenase YdfG